MLTRLQFIILTSLSVLVALCILVQLFLVRASALDEGRLQLTGEALQEGQLDYNRLQQVANWTAAMADKKDDQLLRDLLERNNIQMRSNPAPAPAPGNPAPAAAPSTH